MDKIKTTFIIEWGTYCYKVMPFGLKNIGTTYQSSDRSVSWHDAQRSRSVCGWYDG